jgi:UPF0716 family protein affecting phage T7 exclusion
MANRLQWGRFLLYAVLAALTAWFWVALARQAGAGWLVTLVVFVTAFGAVLIALSAVSK